MRVYLDYAASAPLLPQVQEQMSAYPAHEWGNASALYREGAKARLALEAARSDLASVVSCAPQELYFCSGGTEAAGTLVEGIARGAREAQGKNKARSHILCAAFEHDAVRKSAHSLKRLGFEVELLRPNRGGRIAPEALAAALREDTLMVLIMLAQNELGTVQEIAQLAELAHEVGASMVCDCVQGLCKVPINLAQLGVDAACFSSHKIGGPYGVGAFYLRRLTPFLPRALGGGQESRLRSGTQNVPGAVLFALAATLEQAELAAGEATRLATLRDLLVTTLTQDAPGGRIRSTVPIEHATTTTHLPGFVHLLVQGIESQTLILKLDERGFAVSGGSACSSGSLEPSHVLLSLGIAKHEAHGALRISMGRGTTEEHCARFAEALFSLLKEHR